MSIRTSSSMRGGGGNVEDPMLLADGNLSDDDNAQPELEDLQEQQLLLENEDPLLLAIDDLEGRVVAAIDDVKVHPGVRTTATDAATMGAPTNIHEELAVLLRPVLEVAAHTGPSVARTYYRGAGPEGIEASVEAAYERTVSDLVLPVLLEMAQSDRSPAKRGASLEFFRTLYKECHKAGSWLDAVTVGPQAGPYGPGGSHHSAAAGNSNTPAMRALLKRRQAKRLIREGEILRYWIEAAVACLVVGVFTDAEAEGAVASRAIIAASAALRPSLRHISQRIRDADDRGAARLYTPVMKMVEGVLRKLVLSSSSESVRSACIKFLEIVILCCSRKPQNEASKKKVPTLSDDFSLEDMPTGHPSITREALESIGEYAFVILRGMTMVGGQVKIYHSEINRFGTSPSEQVTSILKPAALAYLEVESTVPKNSDGEHALNFELDRSNVELDFKLSQKAYALTINAMSALAMNRPVFFNEAAACLARRAVQPPLVEDGHFSKAAVLVVASQLRASCLTLLRNASSVTTGASDILFKALVFLDMELQAEKALKMANQANELKTAGRAARNQAKMFYEWDASENDRRSTKRQKETDDALAKMRAAKRQRGLGGGIQLPSSMSDAIELILLNLPHLPKTNPSPSTQSSIGAERVTLEYVIDAVMTNGASIIKEEGRWYDRNGGTAWTLDLTATENYVMCPKFSGTINHVAENLRGGGKLDEHADTQDVLFRDQCSSAASDAFNRILAMATSSRSKYVANLSSQLAARLAFTLQSVPPSGIGNAAHATAKECISTLSNRVPPDEAKMLIDFVDSYPLVAASLTLASSSHSDPGDSTHSVSTLGNMLLNEAFLQATWNAEATKESFDLYDVSLNVFVASVVHSGQLAKDKPSDTEKKRAASQASAVLQKYIATLPRLTKQSLVLLSALCDIDDITKKANKPAQEEVAAAASAHAAKSAAEKRATAALLILRDIAFQKNTEVRMFAVECAVGIASGRLPASPGIQDKALKLAMNVLFTKNDAMGALVADAARSDLEWAAAFAIEQFSAVQVANNESQKVHDSEIRNPLGPRSETEKVVLEKVRKPAVLFMALCVRRPEMIQTLFSLSCQAKADVLSKAVRLNMVKLSRAAGVLHGVAAVALQVAEMTGLDETSMLLAFLENLAPTTEKNAPNQEIIDACFQIQETMFTRDGKKDARYLIPIVSFIKRIDLVNRLHEFVAADDNVFLAALVRMGDRVGRLALHFREEPDAEHPSLLGMTLCEQLVYLHRLDFNATCLPQKRYLSAIKLCLENDEIFSDRVLMSAIDEMSGQFLSGSEKLPLAFMRTNIIVCSKYESLHSWICQVLLPRLVEGKIWNDLRQWEGWMRCAHMLEKSGDPSVDSTGAIETLPAEQLAQYRTKWAATGSIPP